MPLRNPPHLSCLPALAQLLFTSYCSSSRPLLHPHLDTCLYFFFYFIFPSTLLSSPFGFLRVPFTYPFLRLNTLTAVAHTPNHRHKKCDLRASTARCDLITQFIDRPTLETLLEFAGLIQVYIHMITPFSLYLSPTRLAKANTSRQDWTPSTPCSGVPLSRYSNYFSRCRNLSLRIYLCTVARSVIRSLMIITKHLSENCQLQTQEPHSCSTCHCPIGNFRSVTGEDSLSLRKPIVCAHVLQGVASSVYLITPLCSPSCVHESPACNAPLTQFSIQSYACTVMVIGSTTLASPPPRDLWFHKDGVSSFLPWSAFTQLSIGCTYLSQLAVIAFFFPSVNLSMSFVTFTHLIAAEHLHNIRLPRHCHQRFFFPCHRPGQ
jgi:hypothetical protein